MFKPLADPSLLRILWRGLGRPDEFDCISYLEAPRHQSFSAHPIFTQRVEPACDALAVSSQQGIAQLAAGRPLALLAPHDSPPGRFQEDAVFLGRQHVPFETFQVDRAGHVIFRGGRQEPEGAHPAGTPALQLLVQAGNVRRTGIPGLPVTLECSTRVTRTPAAGTQPLRISLRLPPGRQHAVPPPTHIDIPEQLRDIRRLHIGAATHPGGRVAWSIQVENADGLHPLQAPDDLQPQPPQVAFIFDRTSVDPRRWLFAQKLFSQREAVDENIARYRDADPGLANPADWNRELRTAAEDWLRRTLDAGAAGAVRLFWFADRANGLDYPKMDGLEEPRTLAAELDIIDAPQQAQGALDLAGYSPGIDMYDALSDALELAIKSLRSPDVGTPRGVIILGDSPPHPAGDEDEMLTAIEEGTDRHSARTVGNAGGAGGAPPWPIQLKMAQDHHIHVSYVFIRTRSTDALGWIAAEGTPEERAATGADFNRYEEIKRRVEKALGLTLVDKGMFHVATHNVIAAKLDTALADIRDGPVGGTLLIGRVTRS